MSRGSNAGFQPADLADKTSARRVRQRCLSYAYSLTPASFPHIVRNIQKLWVVMRPFISNV